MELIDSIKVIAQRYKQMQGSIQTEEAAKTALVMPFIQALGYDVFNPSEVVPEFVADIVDRKGEKIDYAIMKDGAPIMLIECKWTGTDLTADNRAQLARYFMVVPARIGVLTNGVDYEFYSDLDEAQKLDNKPFLKFNINEVNDAVIRELKKFCKSSFDIDSIIPAAEELKYTNELKKYLLDMLNEPNDEFVKFMSRKVYDGRLTSGLMEKFTNITKRAFGQFISERVSDRLTSALKEEKDASKAKEETPQEPEQPESEDEIVTTQEEIDAYNIVKAILCKTAPVNRLILHDYKGHCSVCLDDRQKWTICRIRIQKRSKSIDTFEESKEGVRHTIETLDDIYNFADALIATATRYVAESTEKKG
ncbi:type I restriction endonuclease [Cloacibacillus sp. An23]|uniref:type I restriction endonuclease n=1 Tax=Cloacibacillus sp. An23 TaxID=1965591 RepID=UPI000B3ADFAC|nr:type I restriction endonuclease [Cloacibacillus sp. An23]OUO94757.1 hypothetical protein B5F39_02500 [Cloacibacillus sp. An23]